MILTYDYMIYPKQFRSAKIPIEKNYCFFLMPFQEKFDSIYGTIKDMLIDYGYICNRADELSKQQQPLPKMTKQPSVFQKAHMTLQAEYCQQKAITVKYTTLMTQQAELC